MLGVEKWWLAGGRWVPFVLFARTTLHVFTATVPKSSAAAALSTAAELAEAGARSEQEREPHTSSEFAHEQHLRRAVWAINERSIDEGT